MRRVIVFFIALLIFVLLLFNYPPNPGIGFGPSENGENPGSTVRLSVTIVVDGVSYTAILNKYEALANENIIVPAGREVSGIYYDASYEEPYRQAPIKANITLYVKTTPKEPDIYRDMLYTLYDENLVENNGYSGAFLLKTQEEIAEHFSLFPVGEDDTAQREAIEAHFNNAFFREQAVIIAYVRSGIHEDNFLIGGLRKVGATIEILITYDDKFGAPEGYCVFIIVVAKSDIGEKDNVTFCIAGHNGGYYYAVRTAGSTRVVTLIIGGERQVLSVPVNYTVSVYDISNRDKYTDIRFYTDEGLTQPYDIPVTADVTIYVRCLQKMFTVIFIIDGYYRTAFVDAGHIITLEDVPRIDGYSYKGLYHDAIYRVLYQDEPIGGNIALYVETEQNEH